MKKTVAILIFSTLSALLVNAQYNYSNEAGMLTIGESKLYSQDAQGKQTGYRFPPLPYTYNGLQPAIDSLTVAIHYNRHHRGYFDKFVAAIKGTPFETQSISQIFAGISGQPATLRNNGGGYYNHFLYWENMQVTGGSVPSGNIASAIVAKYGTIEAFREKFITASMSIFGSGWTWLILNKNNEIEITTTPNQDNPLMDVAQIQGIPLLALDVWEHAYYLNYQNKRAEYINAFWKIINWDEVERRYALAIRKN